MAVVRRVSVSLIIWREAHPFPLAELSWLCSSVAPFKISTWHDVGSAGLSVWLAGLCPVDGILNKVSCRSEDIFQLQRVCLYRLNTRFSGHSLSSTQSLLDGASLSSGS